MKLEHWDLEPVRRRAGIIRAVATLAIAIPLLGAAGTVGYRVRAWKGNSDSARCVATDAHAPERERVQALVAMKRDADLTVAMLRQLAQEPGDVGSQARNLLHHLREKCQ